MALQTCMGRIRLANVLGGETSSAAILRLKTVRVLKEIEISCCLLISSALEYEETKDFGVSGTNVLDM